MVKYLIMSNITTVEVRTITSRVVRLVKKYNKLVKLKSKQNPAQVKEREDFVNSLANLVDIASLEAAKEMVKNRLLGNKEKEPKHMNFYMNIYMNMYIQIYMRIKINFR